MISPCSCRGSLRFVHSGCLQHWFDVMHTKRCQICKTNYEMEYRGMKPILEWTLPTALSDEWEDQLDFKCAIFWLMFMTRILFAVFRYGPVEAHDAVKQVLGSGKVYYIWICSFCINFVYYSLVVNGVVHRWIEANSVYEWKSR
uniref:RING-CH-type domain-containing protein n=1 Tax=Ascaris lumbricoides TaxID=6252 RepID=A0A0M3IAY2_ASCLU